MDHEVKRSAREEDVLLAIWKALLGQITPNMRAIYIDWDEEVIRLYFFFDGDITEEEREDISCIETEVISQIPDSMYELHCIRLDCPKPIVCSGSCVYKRKEAMVV